MIYSITARRKKARFLCTDLSIEYAESLKRKLEIDGWTAIIIREVSQPQNAAQSVTDALDGIDGIDTDARFPLFLATCMLLALALIGYLVYLAAFAFPVFGAVSQIVGWFLLAFGLVTAVTATWKGLVTAVTATLEGVKKGLVNDLALRVRGRKQQQTRSTRDEKETTDQNRNSQ